jgi:hypothetical protein
VEREGSHELKTKPQVQELNTELASRDDDQGSQGYSSSDFYKSYYECLKLEHVGRLSCKREKGYSGFSISAEQMRGYTTVQCLVRKGHHWKPEFNAQDFGLLWITRLLIASGGG